jgi:serine/threonine protein kinase
VKAQLDALIGVTLKHEGVDRFELRAVIGHGGMGAVYDAVDRKNDYPVAVKIILPALAADLGTRQELTQRFLREARNTIRLSHQNIVTVKDSGEDIDREMLYLVMEKLAGRTLQDEIDKHGRILPKRAVHILAQACAAIDYAHTENQIHRDLKPSNLMLIKRGRESDFVKVLDFGLARSSKGDDKLTGTGQILGTAHYMAPEQVDARYSLGPACDIWAMGVVAYHVLSGQVPFVGNTLGAIFYSIQTTKHEPLAKVVPGLPKSLSDVVDRALHKRPDARFRTMDDLRDAFESAVRSVAAEPAVTRPTPPPMPVQPEPVSVVPETLPPPSIAEQLSKTIPPVASSPRLDPNAAARAQPGAQRMRVAVDRKLDVTTPHAGVLAATRPALCAFGDNAALLYEQAPAGASRVGCQLIRPGLGMSSQIALTRPPSIALAPTAIAIDGRLLVAWVDARARNGTSQIYAGLWSPDETAAVSENALGDPGARVAAPTIAPTREGAIVAWHEVVRNAARVVVVLLDRTGRVVSGPIKSPSGSFPTIACGPDSSLVAWHEVASAGEKPSIRVCSIALSHGHTSTPVRWPHDNNAAFPVLAPVGDGSFVMLWWCGAPTPAAMICRVSRDGTPAGEPVRLGPASKVAHRGNLVAVAGGFVASWTARPTEGVVASWIASDLSGPPQDPTALDDSRPASATLARLGEGVVAVWSKRGEWAAALDLTQLALVPA